MVTAETITCDATLIIPSFSRALQLSPAEVPEWSNETYKMNNNLFQGSGNINTQTALSLYHYR